ncbi:MAG TPA: tRNA preQ1(34) S-adenosylmethionine ribosyltransferase-isomerase QueA [Chloroflexota bacterium]
MRTADFDYELPDELIAQAPIEPRDAARLLVMQRSTGALAHRWVRDLPDLLDPGDLLVANRSRVLPARIRGTLRGGGQAELLLLRRISAGRWQALTRPARRLRPGDVVQVTPALAIHIEGAHAEGIRDIRVDSDAALLAAGDTPLPPYIRGWHGDPERYQTMFADVDGSAAAPTAGLHFTPSLVSTLAARGVDIATITLHVGLDTFRPITHEDPAQHRMHREWYCVPGDVAAAIAETHAAGRRVVAVGTTSVRALEAWALTGHAEGETDLFIMPGYRFQVVDALLTNFHLPRSTLLMLVSAFAGRERAMAAYAEAIRERYRFYSFGDATLILGATQP